MPETSSYVDYLLCPKCGDAVVVVGQIGKMTTCLNHECNHTFLCDEVLSGPVSRDMLTGRWYPTSRGLHG
jgi:hypothetical protein